MQRKKEIGKIKTLKEYTIPINEQRKRSIPIIE